MGEWESCFGPTTEGCSIPVLPCSPHHVLLRQWFGCDCTLPRESLLCVVLVPPANSTKLKGSCRVYPSPLLHLPTTTATTTSPPLTRKFHRGMVVRAVQGVPAECRSSCLHGDGENNKSCVTVIRMLCCRSVSEALFRLQHHALSRSDKRLMRRL